ncbi:MAG: phosphotransferase [Streptosporangiales bacterium]|nr:phosphotransferase [Streptosporangiales bacterium]
MRAPLGIADLKPDWLTDVLAAASGGAEVVGVEAVQVGNGMVADSVRLRLTWDRPNPGPDVLIAKVPAAAEESRATAAAQRTYELEAAFYRDLAATVGVHTPRCYASAFDPETQGYVVLLEDLAPAEVGDQVTGCTVDQAAATVRELVALHASRWDDPELIALDWLTRPEPGAAEFVGQLVNGLLPGFTDRYRDRLDPEVMALVHRYIPQLGELAGHRPRPWTLVHGDFRLDNLLFGGERVAVLDWQTIKIGKSLSDVAYFVGSGLLPEERRAHEQDLVRAYHAGLRAAGVELSWDEVWHDYRRYSFDGLTMAVAASMLVTRTDRGDDMFMAMAERHGRQALDLDAESLLGG